MYVTYGDWMSLIEQIKQANTSLMGNDSQIYELVQKLIESSKQQEAKIAELQSTVAELLLLK
jgi:hypothetical protein